MDDWINPFERWRIPGEWMQGVSEQLHHIQQEQKKIMAILDDIKAAQAKTQADLDALLTAFNTFVAGVATGVITQKDAQAVLDAETSEDTKVTDLIAAVNKAANPTP